MKRFLALVLSLAMCLSLLASCSSSSESSDDTTDTTEETTETEETESEETESEDAGSEDADSEDEETEEEDTSDSEEEETPTYGGTVNAYYFMEFSGNFDVSVSMGPSSFYTDYLWNIDWDADRDEIDYGSAYITSEYMVGQLAESWEVADDYSYMSVTIRDDVYFQDKSVVDMEEYDIYGGRQLTAEDVKYSYDRLLGLDGVEKVELDFTDWESTLSMLDSVEVVDDYNLIFYFNTTDEISVSDFICAFVGICGEEWDELTEDEQANWHYASGTGPFYLTGYVSDNTMTFVKNENYWGTDSDGNQLPYVDEVNLIYMTDTATLLASFISGEIDLVVGSSTIFDSDQVSQLEAALDEDEYEEFVYIADYNSIGLKQGDNPNEALADETVRTAMQYALDVEALSTYAGYTYDSTEEMLSGVFGYGINLCDTSSWSDELVESYTTYDPDYALELLEEAGYADGFSFDIALSSTLDTDLYALAAEYLAEIGIDANINVVTTSTEMQSIGQDSTDPTCIQYALASYSVSGLSGMFGSQDSVIANDDDVDAAYADLLAATTLDEQLELAKELDQIYMEKHYLLMVTYNKVDSRWSRTRMHGYSGEDVTKNTYFGYTMARVWVDDEE